MATWGELAAAAPELAKTGRRLLYRTGSGEALLATVRGDAPPRIHPIAVAIVDDGLYGFILPSAKLRDLGEDGRFALHAYPDAERPHEFQVRGRVRPVDEATRAALATGWSFIVGSSPAFEFLIEDAVVGERDSRDEWPPRYTSWTERASPTADGEGHHELPTVKEANPAR